MTRQIPSYLRVHRGPDLAELALTEAQVDPVQEFWTAYTAATGWRIDERCGESRLSPELLSAVISDCDEHSLPPVGRIDALRLAELSLELVRQLESARESIRRQEAELATRASMLTGSLGQAQLADRLEATLADAVAACDCDAAAMYLLDDETEHLKSRAVYGLPPGRLEQSPRALRGSRSDLEAMVQGVVAIDDLNGSSIDVWNCPETSAAAAICAVIQTDDVPIGTLWLYKYESAKFDIPHTAAARMASTQLALQLAVSGETDPDVMPPDKDSIHDVAGWQFDSLPIGTTIAEGWRVDGMIESPHPWATGWHTWDILPDGTMMLAIAEAIDQTARGAMTATAARAALASHVGYRHTPSQLMSRVSDTLWQTSTAEQLMSLMYLQVDPETGEGEIASAGGICVMIGSKYGYRPLLDGRGEPLCARIDARLTSERFRLTSGDVLLGYGQGLIDGEGSQFMLGDCIRRTMQQGETSPLAAIRRALAGLPLTRERGAVMLMRQ